jgi:hypothetical protein
LFCYSEPRGSDYFIKKALNAEFFSVAGERENLFIGFGMLAREGDEGKSK